MTTTFVASSERTSAFSAARSCLLWMLALLGCLLCTAASAHAENALNDMSYLAVPGGNVEITLKFAEPVAPPQVFSTENPPSIALDFPSTHNAFAKRHLDIGTGSTSGVTALEAGGRTRVVVDLFHTAGHDISTNGNTVVLTVKNSLTTGSSVARSAARSDPTKRVSSDQGLEITNVDFRRGKDGEGRVVISFSGPGAAVNLKRDGNTIMVDMLDATVSPSQAKQLDVLDFATPVQSIDTRPHGQGVRMAITATPPFDELAFQSGNEYVVEVKHKQEAPKVTGPNAQPVYAGSRVTFNFQDIPVRSVLQLIADVSDINIVVSDSVQGNVTLRLINVPWDQALDIVLRAKGLDERKQGNVIWVAPQKEISERELSLADANMKLQDKEPLESVYIPISYGKAKDIAALMTTKAQQSQGGGGGGAQEQRGFLSSRGSVSYDDRTNTLLVSDIPSRITEIRALVAVLDRAVRQVLIESRIVIANDTFARELGVKFGISGGYQTSNGNVVTTSGTAAGTDQMNNVVINNRLNGASSGLPAAAAGAVGSGLLVPSLGNRLNVNLPAVNPAGSFGLAILGADYLLDLELSAAQTEGRGEVISRPHVITANQKEADIKQGQQIGYLQYSGGAGGVGGGAIIPTVAFVNADLELKVTPTITADDRINLDLKVKKDDVAGYVQVPGGGSVPTLNTREVSTTVLVDDGQTVVLGGVAEVSKLDTVNKVPVLGDMPILGNLFKTTGRNDSKAELLIFVTPRIVNDNVK